MSASFTAVSTPQPPMPAAKLENSTANVLITTRSQCAVSAERSAMTQAAALVEDAR